jgi:hypothetical protein
MSGGPSTKLGRETKRWPLEAERSTIEARLIVATLAQEFAVESRTDAPIATLASATAVLADSITVCFERR